MEFGKTLVSIVSAMFSLKMKGLIQYFCEIKPDKAILWCYLIWYVVTVFFYFDPSPKVWINAVGISIVIGTGLLLSISSGQSANRDNWQTFRLYLMPFCVSSFSALIKEKEFIVILSPNAFEAVTSVSCCTLFLLFVRAIKLIKNRPV